MKMKSLNVLSLFFLYSLSIGGLSLAVNALEDDKPHLNGEKDIVIDYHDFGDDEIAEDRPFDDSQKYDYSSFSLNNKNGSFTKNNDVYTSNAINTLAVCDDIPFPYGSFEVLLTRASSTCDQGIVFSLSDSNKTSYWEGSGVSYYFFFLARNGQLSLGKTTNGLWTTRYETSVGAVSPTAEYKMKVVMKSNLMIFFFNDQIKFYLKDNEFLIGTKWGIRAGDINTNFTITKLTSDYIVE